MVVVASSSNVAVAPPLATPPKTAPPYSRLERPRSGDREIARSCHARCLVHVDQHDVHVGASEPSRAGPAETRRRAYFEVMARTRCENGDPGLAPTPTLPESGGGRSPPASGSLCASAPLAVAAPDPSVRSAPQVRGHRILVRAHPAPDGRGDGGQPETQEGTHRAVLHLLPQGLGVGARGRVAEFPVLREQSPAAPKRAPRPRAARTTMNAMASAHTKNPLRMPLPAPSTAADRAATHPPRKKLIEPDGAGGDARGGAGRVGVRGVGRHLETHRKGEGAHEQERSERRQEARDDGPPADAIAGGDDGRIGHGVGFGGDCRIGRCRCGIAGGLGSGPRSYSVLLWVTAPEEPGVDLTGWTWGTTRASIHMGPR